MRFGLLLTTLLALGSLQAPKAQAQDGDHRLELGPEYRRFDAVEYGVAGAMLVGSGVIKLLSQPPAEAALRGGAPLDGATRDLFCGVSRESRDRADFWSDVTWYGAQGWPVVIDTVLVAWLLDGFNHDVAWQMMAMNYEAYGVAGLIISASHWLVGRERPSGYSCDEDGQYDPLCGSRALYASFLSGHTGMAFVGAGLTCAHHQHLPLFGGGGWDVAACGLVTGLASATGILRIMADRHYLSDVVISAAIGWAAGYLLPTFLHYQAGDPQPPDEGMATSELLAPRDTPPQINLGIPW